MDVTLEEGYLNISHPRLGMASIRCQRRGDVLVHSDGYWLILFREKKRTRRRENKAQKQGTTKRARK